MDRILVNQKCFTYAKVCVEIEATMEIPYFIKVELRDGTFVSITIDIPRLPMKCS